MAIIVDEKSERKLKKELAQELFVMADDCDQSAESCNNHDFVGLHEKLAKLLVKKVGLGNARIIMTAIKRKRGLDGLNEVGFKYKAKK